MRTEDCEGPVPDTPPMEQNIIMNEERTVDSSNGEPGGAICSNRAELMERLKKGEAPQWIPNQSVRDEKKDLGHSSALRHISIWCPICEDL